MTEGKASRIDHAEYERSLHKSNDSDLIRRSDAIKAYNDNLETSEVGTMLDDEKYLQALQSIPAVEPKHGEWIMNDIQCKEDTDNGNYQYTCSECGHGDIHAKTQEVPYCWWCGAKMKGAEDE